MGSQQPQKHGQQVNEPLVSGDKKLDQPLWEGISSKADWAQGQVKALRSRFGISELVPEAIVMSRGENPNTACEMMGEIHSVTMNSLKFLIDRGYDVTEIAKEHEIQIGTHKFDGEALAGVEGIPDIVGTVGSATIRVWDRVEEKVRADAEKTAVDQLKDKQMQPTSGERVAMEMTRIWDSGIGNPKIGGNVENLRSRVGIRTLSALMQRYTDLGRKMPEYAEAAAVNWSHIAYERTKHCIAGLRDRAKGSIATDLHMQGSIYEREMGDDKLGRGDAFTEGDKGWIIVQKTLEQTKKTWDQVKI